MCDSLGQSDQKVKAYKLKMFGQTVVYKTQDEMLESIKMDTEDYGKTEIEIEVTEMYEHEIDGLPEFEGY